MFLPIQVSTGDIYFYCGGRTQFMMRSIFTMDEPVSRDHLQQAVDTAMRRYPYFRLKAVLSDSTYTMEQNNLPFVVYEGDEFISLGDPRINGHLFSFACSGNNLYIDYFHGVTDGRGIMPLIRSLFYYYSIYHYGETPEMADVRMADDPVDSAEWVDPITVPVPELVPFHLNIPGSAYQLPEEKFPKGTAPITHTFRVPQADFMRYVKSVDGSPAAVAALFLCRAIDAVHPEHEQPIVCGMAAEFRNELGCPKAFKSCLSTLSLEYSSPMRVMPIDRQTTVFRGKIALQSSAEHLLPKFAQRQKNYAQMEMLPTLKEKQIAIFKDLMAQPVTANCSYSGKTDLGSMERHVQEKHIYSKFGGRGIVIEMSAIGEFFGIDFTCEVDSEAYVKEFVCQLENEGIRVEKGEPISFVISPRCF